MSGIFRPMQFALQRVTRNAGNRRYIRGGQMAPLLPLTEGITVENMVAPLGVEFWHEFAGYFSGPGEFGLVGVLPDWLAWDESAGVLAGEPVAPGLAGPFYVTRSNLGHVVRTNDFYIEALP